MTRGLCCFEVLGSMKAQALEVLGVG
jgi:hypothetical protein